MESLRNATLNVLEIGGFRSDCCTYVVPVKQYPMLYNDLHGVWVGPAGIEPATYRL